MTLTTRETSALHIAAQATQLLEVGSILIKSGMLPSGIRTPEAAMAIIVKGMELGLPPMAALSGITVIQGKPTVSPQLMLSLINRSGQLENIEIVTSKDGAAVTMKRRGRTAFTSKFGPVEAKAMGLDGKDNYEKQPAVMYQWRAVAGCARVVFPDVIDGLYTPEEMGAEVQVDEDGAVTVNVQQEEKPAAPSDSERLDKAVRAIENRTNECEAAGNLQAALALGMRYDYHNDVKAAEALFRALKPLTVALMVEPVEAEVISEGRITDATRGKLMGHLKRAGIPDTSEARTAFFTWFVSSIPAGTRTNDLSEDDAQRLIDALAGLDSDGIRQTGAEFIKEVNL